MWRSPSAPAHWHQLLRSAPQPGQALVLVALVVGVLITLAVGIGDVLLQRRAHSRIQHALDTAAVAALTPLDYAALVHDAPRLDRAAAEQRFRAALANGVERVTGQLDADPATVAQRAQLTIRPMGGLCQGARLSGPGLCATLTVTVQHPLGASARTFQTVALVTPNP